MSTLDTVFQHREDITAIALKHGATNIRIFGSVARGTEATDSDLDLLVDVGAKVSPWFPVRFVDELKALLHLNIDVVIERSLNPRLREVILNEAVHLWR